MTYSDNDPVDIVIAVHSPRTPADLFGREVDISAISGKFVVSEENFRGERDMFTPAWRHNLGSCEWRILGALTDLDFIEKLDVNLDALRETWVREHPRLAKNSIRDLYFATNVARQMMSTEPGSLMHDVVTTGRMQESGSGGRELVRSYTKRMTIGELKQLVHQQLNYHPEAHWIAA